MRAIIFIAISIILPGCGAGALDSEDIKTSGIYAGISTISYGDNSTDILVHFKTGNHLGADDIKLSGGDSLTVTANGQTKVPEWNYLLAWYETSFNFNEGGTEFRVSLDRREDEDMPDSIVTLPHKFNITSPDAGLMFVDGDNLTVTWGPVEPDVPVKYKLSVTCVDAEDERKRDTVWDSGTLENDLGIHIFSISDFIDYALNDRGVNTNAPCLGEVEISKTRYGILDDNYGKGGYIVGEQIRTVAVTVDMSLPE